ncbi:hypothetical protein [Paenibacillus larvae]|uniref:hypothetical protein n=1 Tax=Paenibacillus larvae TaxID=1464 RepID=UPI0037C5C1BB
MLRKTGYEGRSQISMVSLDELVPIDHLVRKSNTPSILVSSMTWFGMFTVR